MSKAAAESERNGTGTPSREDVVLAWLQMQQAVMLAYLGRPAMGAEPVESEYDGLASGTMLYAEDNVGTAIKSPTQDSYLVWNKDTGRPHWQVLPAVLQGG